jgi:uncharacterized protein YjbI with pentapeptide repeats
MSTCNKPIFTAIQPPNLAQMVTDLPLTETIQSALHNRADIDSARFTDDAATDISGALLEFSGCLFERCTFHDWDLKRICFVDCLLDHCDISGMSLANVTFQRVRFQNCRLTGTAFLQAALMNVSLEGCSGDYFTLTQAKCTHVQWKDCRLKESVWQEVVWKSAAFAACDLTGAQVLRTPMAGMYMTTCTLDSLRIDPYDLRGMKVTPSQAIMFCALLGLDIITESLSQEG